MCAEVRVVNVQGRASQSGASTGSDHHADELPPAELDPNILRIAMVTNNQKHTQSDQPLQAHGVCVCVCVCV